MLLTAALQAAKGCATFPSHPDRPEGYRTVAKPELGTKRVCGNCSAKFYDLSKDPIHCPKCGTVFEVVVAPAPRGRAEAAAAAGAAEASAAAAAAAIAARAPAKEAEAEAPETADVELVSLEEADAETEGKKAAGDVAEGDDDIDIEETEEAPFIEETEEGDEDVTDIIGEGREDEEET
jgi:uncharacterized protein (TIGR02300 family)